MVISGGYDTPDEPNALEADWVRTKHFLGRVETLASLELDSMICGSPKMVIKIPDVFVVYIGKGGGGVLWCKFVGGKLVVVMVMLVLVVVVMVVVVVVVIDRVVMVVVIGMVVG